MKSAVLKILVVVGVACVLTVGLEAADGVLIVSKTTTGASSRTSQIQIERTRMRAEVSDPTGAKQTIVFDGAKQVLYMIDAEKKTYTEMTQADAARMGGAVSSQMAQMNAAMEKMPPAQRAQMEAMMAGMGARGGMPAAPTKTVYKKTGTDKVGKWTCDKYEGTQGTLKTSEVCTVDPSALGFALADFAVTRQMADFFSKLSPQAAGQMLSIGQTAEQGYSGMPVRSVTMAGIQPTTTEVTEVTRQTFADSLFAVPAGFKKVDFMAGRGRQ